jgi:hypothetical protein
LKLDVASASDNTSWNILATKQINDCIVSATSFNEDQRMTICYFTATTDTHYVNLFLINKGSEHVG